MKNKKPKEMKVKPQKVKKEKIEKPKKERKPWPIQTILSLLGLLCIVIYLAIAIRMHFKFPGFSMPWFWFGFVAVAALVAPIGLFVGFLPRQPNKKQFTAAVKSSIYLTFFIWFFDLLYMAIFNRWIVLEYVFGLIAIVLLFTNLVRSFLSDKKGIKWILSFEFLADVGLSVYLIFRIPNDDLRTIVTTVAAALFGGCLTLVGVAWTIRQGQKERAEDRKQLEEDRKEEESKKAKPLFTFGILDHERVTPEGSDHACFLDCPGPDFRDCCLDVEIDNSIKSAFVILGMFSDNEWNKVKGCKTVLPGKKVFLSAWFKSTRDIIMKVSDSLEKIYYYEMIVLFRNKDTELGQEFYTVIDLNEISVDELKARNIPLEDTP